MYEVKCYDRYGDLVEPTDSFDTYEEAYAFAKEMAEHYLVDIETPNGTVICVN